MRECGGDKVRVDAVATSKKSTLTIEFNTVSIIVSAVVVPAIQVVGPPHSKVNIKKLF